MSTIPFIGQVQSFGFGYPPRGWLKCEGQLLPIASHTALFSIIGTIYGGDGRTTFGLPDLRGRVPRGEGTGPGLGNVRLGERGGQESHQLTTNELAGHSHALSANAASGAGEIGSPSDAVVLGSNDAHQHFTTSANETMGPVATAPSGGNAAFEVLGPSLGSNWCIAIDGQYPSRS
ncbi:MAG: tail fiber protein [Pseudomonadota bacterium]